MPADATVLLQLKGICKSFGATRALDGVDLRLKPGEIHALIGENGAGKSTLMKILSGAYRADQGALFLDGRPLQIENPLDARRRGIAMVYQELNLAPHLTVEENLTLGVEKKTLGFVRSQAPEIREALELLSHAEIPLNARISTLSIGLQQIVEIARGLIGRARILIMDEPTSSLSASDTCALFQVVARIKASGRSVVYISHFLEEIFEIADTYTVLRDGRTVASGRIKRTDVGRIIHHMVGRDLNQMFPRVPHRMGDVCLRVQGLSGAPVPHDVSFALRRGEIMGLAGLVGSGRSETVRRVFGLERACRGALERRGEGSGSLARMNPRRALRMGIDFLSENRKDEGLATRMSVAHNTTLSSLERFVACRRIGLLNLRAEGRKVDQWIERLHVRCRGSHQRVGALSGGNQQKVALARVLQQDAEVVLLDEPTRGVDVGSKVDIYQLIGELAQAGKSVLFVSSYLPELLGVCDTLGVMHRGRLQDVRPVAEWDEPSIMQYATAGHGRGERTADRGRQGGV